MLWSPVVWGVGGAAVVHASTAPPAAHLRLLVVSAAVVKCPDHHGPSGLAKIQQQAPVHASSPTRSLPCSTMMLYTQNDIK
jgi:hypothetical protein